ncbi:MAG TPA: hypothetical protein VNA86_01860 [bacterium]|nr:hypothetical protein [bacterium]
MRRSGEFWELAACGAAAGGISVWVLAAAARAGWLRALLDLFPRGTWDGMTWALIPLLLLVPMMLQGTVVAEFSARPRPIARTIAGSIGGSILALAVAGILVSTVLRRIPPSRLGTLTRPLPEPLLLAAAVLLGAGSLLTAGRLAGSLPLRRAALPAAALGVAAAWLVAPGRVLSAIDVLDRIEVAGFFLGVMVGGALGSAWLATRTAGSGLTGRRACRYNVRNSGRRSEHGEEGGGPSLPSMARK